MIVSGCFDRRSGLALVIVRRSARGTEAKSGIAQNDLRTRFCQESGKRVAEVMQGERLQLTPAGWFEWD
jgi:hypothetical protein